MKLIIDLSDEDFIAIKDCHAKIGEDLFNLERNMAIAIRNGIPYEEKPQGEWIYRENFKKHQCNKCGMFMPISKEDIEDGYKLPNFCSNCGAEMKGDTEE